MPTVDLNVQAPAGIVPPQRRQAGFSLIELMIAVTVALLMLTVLAFMFGSSIKARNQIERSNRQTENGRYAIQLLRDDIQLAGFWGEFNMRDLGPNVPNGGLTALPDVCVTHNDSNADLPADKGIVVPADVAGDAAIDGLDYLWAVTPLHVQGFNDVDVATLPDCLSGADVRPDTDIIVVRRVLTCRAGVDPNCAFNANAPYLQASQCDTQINTVGVGNSFRLRADASNAQFVLMDLTCTAGTITPVRRYVTHIYFVANNNVAGDGIPTLKRRELISTGFTTAALVEGIEDLQFEYGVDTSGDGMPDGDYDSDPGDSGVADADTGAWSNVMTARIHLLSRSTEERPGYVDNNTYALGTKNIAAPGDKFTRQVFQTVVQLHNPVGRRQ